MFFSSDLIMIKPNCNIVILIKPGFQDHALLGTTSISWHKKLIYYLSYGDFGNRFIISPIADTCSWNSYILLCMGFNFQIKGFACSE